MTVAMPDGAQAWTCAERFDLALAAYAVAPSEARDEAFTEILRGWLESSGPMSVAGMAERLRATEEMVETALLRLETQGQVLRGRFTGSAGEEWCNRRVLARIHRMTIGKLRREIEPVSSATFVAFLQRWQHVAPLSRLHGIDGTLQVIRQLEGYEIPAVAWEANVLADARRWISARVPRPALLRRRRDVGTAHAASGARTARLGRNDASAADAARTDRALSTCQRRRADRAARSATSPRCRTRPARFSK